MIVETGDVETYKHNVLLTKRLKALDILIESMTKKKEKIVEQIKELSHVRMD